VKQDLSCRIWVGFLLKEFHALNSFIIMNIGCPATDSWNAVSDPVNLSLNENRTGKIPARRDEIFVVLSGVCREENVSGEAVSTSTLPLPILISSSEVDWQ
jgi:hypothetical protein